MYLSRLRRELVTDAQNCGIDHTGLNVYISFGEEEGEKDMRTVINDYDLAEKVFTAKCLFVVDKI